MFWWLCAGCGVYVCVKRNDDFSYFNNEEGERERKKRRRREREKKEENSWTIRRQDRILCDFGQYHHVFWFCETVLSLFKNFKSRREADPSHSLSKNA